MDYNRVYISRSNVFRMLKPVKIENAEINETSWTQIEKLNKNTVNNFKDFQYHLQNDNELTILPQSSFKSEPSNGYRESAIVDDAQVPQEAKSKLSLLLQNKFDSIVSKSSTDVGRTNLFKKDIPTNGSPISKVHQ